MQAHIIQNHEAAEIIVFYSSNGSPSTAAALSLYTFVKTIPIDSFGACWEKSRHIGKIIPYLLEYLLVDHELVILVNYNELVDETTMPKILQAVAIHGEVIVPSSDRVGRMARFDPITAGTQFPLLAYTRTGYSTRLKPYFDCRRGLWCPSGERHYQALGSTRGLVSPRGSILKRGSIGLHHGGQPEDALSLQMESQFELISPQREIPIAPHTIRVGLGLEFSEGETASDFIEKKLVPLFQALESQDRTACYILLYVNILTASSSRLDLLRRINSTQLPERLTIKLGLAPILAELSDLVFETAAWKDSCEYFVSLGTPLVLPQSPWLKRLSRGLSLRKSDRLVLVTRTNSSDDLWMLKEFVGSVHNLLSEHPLDPHPLLIVIGSAAIKESDVATIRLWEDIEYHDLSELLFGLPLTMHERAEEEELLIRLMLLDRFTKQYGAAVWIKQGVFFNEPEDEKPSPLAQLNADLISKGLVRVGDGEGMVVEGYDRDAFIQLFGGFHKCVVQLDCSSSIAEYRRVSPLTQSERYSLQSLLPKPTDPTKRGRMYCHLSLRPEIMYSPQLLTGGREQLSQWASPSEDAHIWRSSAGERKRIAFLVPSKSGPLDAPDKMHLLQTFFKSMLNSISADEWLHYQYVIYVGYDEDDPVLDQRRPDLLKAIDRMRGEAHRRDVLFKFHRLPAAKCVTLLWNLLFLDAIVDGNDYFYQVNDDVALLDAGWTSKFVAKLQNSDGFGVTGPNDQLWNCRLLTQSFVSRRHWEIFGWYYPIVIKDWYSDNWISEVYGSDHTYCVQDAAIRNGATSTRYNICDKPKWREAVEEGKRMIELWKRRQIIKFRAKREGP